MPSFMACFLVNLTILALWFRYFISFKLINDNNVITINANQAGDPSVSCVGQLFYSSTLTLTQLRNSYTSNDCIAGGGDCGSSSGWFGTQPVDITGYTVEIIGTP